MDAPDRYASFTPAMMLSFLRQLASVSEEDFAETSGIAEDAYRLFVNSATAGDVWELSALCSSSLALVSAYWHVFDAFSRQDYRFGDDIEGAGQTETIGLVFGIEEPQTLAPLMPLSAQFRREVRDVLESGFPGDIHLSTVGVMQLVGMEEPMPDGHLRFAFQTRDGRDMFEQIPPGIEADEENLLPPCFLFMTATLHLSVQDCIASGVDPEDLYELFDEAVEQALESLDGEIFDLSGPSMCGGEGQFVTGTTPLHALGTVLLSKAGHDSLDAAAEFLKDRRLKKRRIVIRCVPADAVHDTIPVRPYAISVEFVANESTKRDAPGFRARIPAGRDFGVRRGGRHRVGPREGCGHTTGRSKEPKAPKPRVGLNLSSAPGANSGM